MGLVHRDNLGTGINCYKSILGFFQIHMRHELKHDILLYLGEPCSTKYSPQVISKQSKDNLQAEALVAINIPNLQLRTET